MGEVPLYMGRKSVTLYTGTPLCPYGTTYRRAYGPVPLHDSGGARGGRVIFVEKVHEKMHPPRTLP